MIEQFELYINAQKAIANYMLGLGVIMIIFFILLHFGNPNSLCHGLKIGCVIFGLFSAVSGYIYKLTEEKLLEEQTNLFNKSASEFNNIEKERMQKVVKNFPRIQMVFITIIIISLLFIFLVKNNFVIGLLASLVILLLGNIVIEHVSKISIDTYFGKLLKLN